MGTNLDGGRRNDEVQWPRVSTGKGWVGLGENMPLAGGTAKGGGTAAACVCDVRAPEGFASLNVAVERASTTVFPNAAAGNESWYPQEGGYS